MRQSALLISVLVGLSCGMEPEPCSVATDDEGQAVVTCPDGTSVVLKNGRPGKDGADGKDGEPGKDGDAGENGKDGKDGEDGKNGQDGTDGQDGDEGEPGFSTLVRIEDEPIGENCPNGGSRVLLGYDRSGEGFLDDEEVDQTHFICTPCISSSGFSATAPANWPVGAGCFHVFGDVTISGFSGTDLDALPRVVSISGDLIIDGNAGLSSLDGLDLLEFIGGSLVIENNPMLSQCDALALAARLGKDPSGVRDNDDDGACEELE